MALKYSLRVTIQDLYKIKFTLALIYAQQKIHSTFCLQTFTTLNGKRITMEIFHVFFCLKALLDRMLMRKKKWKSEEQKKFRCALSCNGLDM